MIRRRIKIKVSATRNPKSLKMWRDAYRIRLSKCAPFIRGTLSAVGPKINGVRKTYSLVCRQGKSIRSTYIPSSELREVEAMVENYRNAKELLAKIADCELQLLLWRINDRKKKELSASR